MKDPNTPKVENQVDLEQYRVLFENEKLLRTITENYPNSYISIIEKDGSIGFASGQEFKNRKLDPEQFIGLSVDQVFGDQADIVNKYYKKTFEGEACSFELFIDEQHQFYQTVPLRSEDGTVQRILTVVENITERTRTEEELYSLLQHLETAEEMAELGYFERNLSTGKSFWSKGMYKILGLEPDLPNQNAEAIFKLIHPDDREREMNNHRKALTANRNFKSEFRFIKKDGNTGWIHLAGSSKKNKQGHRIQRGIMQNITSRKQTEQRLKDSEKHFRSIIEQATDVLFIQDFDGKIIEVNNKACENIGFSRYELLCMNIGDIAENYADEDLRQSILTKLQKKERVTFETRMMRKDHSFFPVEINLNMITLKNSKAIMGIARDLTHRNLENDLNSLHLRVIDYAFNHSIPELLIKILNEAESLTGSKIGFYHFVSEDQKNVELQTWSTNTSESMCKLVEPNVHYPIAEAGVWVDCIHQGRVVIHNDFAKLKNKKGYPKGHAPIIREILVPVMRNKKVLAILGLGNKDSDYTNLDVEIVQRIVDTSWETIERKLTEEALLESERRLSTLMDNLPGMAFRCLNDQHWTMEFISSGCMKLTGYKSTDLLANKHIAFSELIHPDDRSRVWTSVQNSLARNKSYEIEYRIITAKGKQKYVLELGRGIFEKDQVKYLEGFISDITLRKQAEIKIQKDQDHLEELVQERTRDIEEKNRELERFNKLFVGREFRIKELREKVLELEKKLQAK